MIATHTEIRVECPAEVRAAVPPAIAQAPDAVIKFNGSGQAYINDRFRREEGLAARLDAARAQCPN